MSAVVIGSNLHSPGSSLTTRTVNTKICTNGYIAYSLGLYIWLFVKYVRMVLHYLYRVTSNRSPRLVLEVFKDT